MNTIETEYVDGDFIGGYFSSPICGVPVGYYQGVIVERKGELVVVLNDLSMAFRSVVDSVGTPHYIELDRFCGNADFIKMLFRSGS